MDTKQVAAAIEWLRGLSIELYLAYNDNRSLIDLLNSGSVKARQSLHAQYQRNTEKVNGLRNEIATALLQQDLSVEVLEGMISAAKNAHPEMYRTIYSTWFAILYPFLLEDRKDEMNKCVSGIVTFFENRLNSNLKVKIVDFTGPRNNGSYRLWVAFYNVAHRKQDTAKQLFFEIQNGLFLSSFYDRPNEYHEGELSFGNGQSVNPDLVADRFIKYLPRVLKDKPSGSAIKVISLQPNENIYKVSMGEKEFSDADFAYLIERGSVVMNEDTKSLAREETSQGMYFSEGMHIGDYVYVCHGNAKVVVLGKVISDAAPCDYKDWGSQGWIQRKIEVVSNAAQQEPYNGPQKWWTPNHRSTCYPIPRRELDLAVDYLFKPIFNVIFEVSKHANTMVTPNNNLPRNIVLYGPPGTGKTYLTTAYALSIIEHRPVEEVMQEMKERRSDLLGRFEGYKKLGQVEFITFHQNYTYEEFIQGIRPQIEGVTSLQFEKKDGLFKRFADRALKNLESSAVGVPAYSTDFEDVFEALFKPLIDETGSVRIPMDTPGYSFELTKYNSDQKNLSFVKQSGGEGHTLYVPTLRRYYEQPGIDHIQGLRSYYRPLVRKMQEKALEMEQTKDAEERKNYVLIIDEINRANISRVFGELITLIEEEKRWGNSEGMKLILPSEDEFTVPNNLYIIATMNTADKSIALLDIALRRRFEFRPLYPIYEEGTWWGPFLKQLNQAIFDRKKNADFFIGHAIFINKDVREKVSILRAKVLPLLNEYFHDNGNTALQILKQAGVNCRRGEIDENFQVIIEE